MTKNQWKAFSIPSSQNRWSFHGVSSENNELSRVNETTFSKCFNIKKAERVTLMHSVHVCDCVTNGQLGTVTGAIIISSSDMEAIFVRSDNANVGIQQLLKNANFSSTFPRSSERKIIYNLAGSEHSARATFIQFPHQLPRSKTCH